MNKEEIISKLKGLRVSVESWIKNPLHRYFDPKETRDLFLRFTGIRNELRSLYPSLFKDLPRRKIPKSSGTTDFEGRGYIERKHFELLINDINYCLEILTTSSGVIAAKQDEENSYNLLEEKFSCQTKAAKEDKKYRCFVIMPIGDEDSAQRKNNILVFDKLIKPCVENSGYNIECYHSDLITKTGDISRQVIRALGNDDIVIADLRRNNPNVIYELCIRHAFGKRSIMICSDHSENFFHASKYRALPYKLDGTSNQEFFKRLSGLINDIIKNPNESDNLLSDILGKPLFEHIKINNHEKMLHIARKMKGTTYSLGELYNLSGEDLADCDIELKYTDKNNRQMTVKGRVIDPTEDPMRARPTNLGLLKRKESKHIVNFPRSKVKVIITGKILGTDKKFVEEFDIDALS